MEIGGYDFYCHCTPIPQMIHMLLKCVQLAWPNGHFERDPLPGEEPEPDVPLSAAILRGGHTVPATFFLYESLEAMESWDAHGLTPENSGKMIGVIALEDGFTITVDEPDSGTAQIAKDVIQAFKANIAFFGVTTS